MTPPSKPKLHASGCPYYDTPFGPINECNCGAIPNDKPKQARQWWINPVDNGCRDLDIHVIEYSAYEQAIKERDEARAEVERCNVEILDRARRDQGMIDRRSDLLTECAQALEQIGNANCPRYVAHPQSVWFDIHVQSIARSMLTKLKSHMAGSGGE